MSPFRRTPPPPVTERGYGVLAVEHAQDVAIEEDPWGVLTPRVVREGIEAIPAVGRYAAADAAIAAGAVLGGRWCTVALLGHWAGGAPLASQWRAVRTLAEGDGFVVLLGEDATLTVTGIAAAGVGIVRRHGSVVLEVPTARSAVLTVGGEVAPGSFEVHDGEPRDLRTGHPARWRGGPTVAGGGVRGLAERRIAAHAGRGTGPAVQLVAVV